ncbi:MAG: hypothetical protein IK052_01920 [Bacteroidales bacterium]|nr:hypothetical protein [Bacteroidales bacterium]
MKTRLITALILLSAAFFTSCNKDDASGAKATFRKANISGAQMLALAQGSGTATKAEGDISVGPKALYSVSEDGTMVQVSYNVDVEGASGEVAETIKAELILSPNFIFPVGDGWIWLANCHLDVRDGWSNGTIPEGPARHALSKILNTFSDTYNSRHGAHYLIRKSDGALFEWTLEAGAPDGMDDGFKQPTFLNGWFHQMGKDLYVKTWGWTFSDATPTRPTLYRLQDKGNTLDAVNLLGDNIGCGGIWPAEDCLGVQFQYDGGVWPFGIIAPPSFSPVLLQQESGTGEKNMDTALISVAKKLYLAVNTENNGKNIVTFYNLDVSASSVSRGREICTWEGWISNDPGTLISSADKLTWWAGNGQGGTQINVFDPKAGTVTSHNLPEHYPNNEGEYVNGIGYTMDGTAGFWECDLSKDAAEYIALDWSDALEFQSRIVPGSLRMDRFEAASLTIQFKAQMSDGTRLDFYTSVVGADRGKIKGTVSGQNNAGMTVTTMVRLN